MALLDLLGRNWALGIIWQLSDGPLTFRELQAKCEALSPTTLNTRLKELTMSRLIERTIDGYQLTRLGEELFVLIKPIGGWAKKWAKKIAD
jgi:DNA-binding HxlR family transcriptional regulator